MRVPIETERAIGAEWWLHRQLIKIVQVSGGRLLEGPPQRVDDPEAFMRDTVLYVYPAERPDPHYLRLPRKLSIAEEL